MDPTILLPLEVMHKIFFLLSPSKDIPNAMLVSERWKTILKSVLKLRTKSSFSALISRPPLRWFRATLPSPSNDSPTSVGFNNAPTSRFGATTIIKDDYLYVFGGATAELTAFNDMWVYRFSSDQWRRITKQGDLPSPRAFAKCGFIGNTLYLYGGCHTYRYGINQVTRIDWLDDMYSFCIETQTWKCVKLRRFSEYMHQSPPVIIGQSGIFLTQSDSGCGFPSAMVLFGGYSRPRDTCVNTGYVILPSLSQWFELPDSSSLRKPTGRYGHSACAIDSCRMVVIGGNLRPPVSPYLSPPSSQSEQSSADSLHEVFPPPQQADSEPGIETLPSRWKLPAVEGDPSKDVWLLTRTVNSTNQAFSEVPWFWTRIDCRLDSPENPPPDFYHAVAVGLPLFVEKLESSPLSKSPNNDSMEVELTNDRDSSGHFQNADYFSASVLLISSTSEALLNNICCRSNSTFRAKRNLDSGSRLASNCSSSYSSSSSHLDPGYMEFSDSPDEVNFEVGSKASLSPPFNTVSGLNLRKRISRANSLNRPLVVYTLRLSLPTYQDPPFYPASSPSSTNVSGYWLGPGRPVDGELMSAPSECIGFSCVYGLGSLFLFGGIMRTSQRLSQDSGTDEDADWHPNYRVRSPHPSSQSGDYGAFDHDQISTVVGIEHGNNSPTYAEHKRPVLGRNSLKKSPPLYILQPSAYVNYFG